MRRMRTTAVRATATVGTAFVGAALAFASPALAATAPYGSTWTANAEESLLVDSGRDMQLLGKSGTTTLLAGAEFQRKYGDYSKDGRKIVYSDRGRTGFGAGWAAGSEWCIGVPEGTPSGRAAVGRGRGRTERRRGDAGRAAGASAADPERAEA